MSRAARIARLEAEREPPAPTVPNVLHVRRGETIEDAARRFDATYPKGSKHHRLLIVPCRDASAADHADFDTAFREQQLRSQAEARSAPTKGTGTC